MSVLSFLSRLGFFIAFATVYFTINAVLDSNTVFQQLLYILEDYLALTGYGRQIAPVVRSVVVAILAEIFLEVLDLLLSLAWGCVTICRHIVHSAKPPKASRSKSASKNRTVRPKEQVEPSDNSGEMTAETSDHKDNGVNTDSPKSVAYIYRLLGQAGFNEVRHHILERMGRFPPLDVFPILDAETLRPYHRFSDPALYDEALISLVRQNVPADSEIKPVGSKPFFKEVDRLISLLAERQTLAPTQLPLPIASLRHPHALHGHPYMTSEDNLPYVREFVKEHHETLKEITSFHNPLHRELRILAINLIYVSARLDLASCYGDLITCIDCLEIIDNISTSLLGLCEVEYSRREDVHRAGIL